MLLSLVYLLFFSWVHVDMNGWFACCLFVSGTFEDSEKEKRAKGRPCVWIFLPFLSCFGRSTFDLGVPAHDDLQDSANDTWWMPVCQPAGRNLEFRFLLLNSSRSRRGPGPLRLHPLHVNMEGGVNSEVIEAGLFVRICFQSTGERGKRGRMRVLMNGGRH